MNTEPSMVPFFSRFPDLGLDETHMLEVRPGSPVFPIGTFGYVEYYCNDPGCDCRRVMLKVQSNDEPHDCYATIIWGWEFADYYEPWTKDRYAAELHVAGYLDPDGVQSEHAKDFIDMFRYCISDEAAGWVEQFAGHYDMFKATLGVPPPDTEGWVRCIKSGRAAYPDDYYDDWLRNS